MAGLLTQRIDRASKYHDERRFAYIPSYTAWAEKLGSDTHPYQHCGLVTTNGVRNFRIGGGDRFTSEPIGHP